MRYNEIQSSGIFNVDEKGKKILTSKCIAPDDNKYAEYDIKFRGNKNIIF